MKIEIDEDEMYPYYSYYESKKGTFEVTKDILSRWERIESEFRDMQHELEALYDKRQSQS